MAERYINAYALVEIIESLDVTVGGKSARWYDAKHTVLKEIAEMPAADVVEVVRCKDCVYYEIHKPRVWENCERNNRLIPMNPNDFCSYGKRKDGERE